MAADDLLSVLAGPDWRVDAADATGRIMRTYVASAVSVREVGPDDEEGLDRATLTIPADEWVVLDHDDWKAL